ncbi:MAG TPA: tetratricopeptide repeat protein [Drouetiella sp.]
MSNNAQDEELITEANGGNAQAQLRLAFNLMKNRNAEDMLQAAHYYELAAQQGLPVAQHNLATMYLNGQGVAKDRAKAIHWFEIAAQQGDVDSQFNLALIFDQDFSQESQNKSFEWFETAANNGSARAQYDLAVIYHQGKNRPVDLDKAAFWYSQAAAQGVRRAEEALELLAERT